MLPQFQRHEEDNLEAAERREQRLMELLRQSNEMQRGISAQIEALKAQVTELQSPTSRGPEQKGLPSPTRTVQNPTDRPLRYQETPPLEPVTQDMLNSQMHRLRTPRRIYTLLAGADTKWFWQLMEDKAQDYDFDFYSLT